MTAPVVCRRCGSQDPARHPAVQAGGEVQPCPDPFHLAADTESRVHELKCWAGRMFDAVLSGQKPFDVRRDDRGFQPGDLLMLREYEEGDPAREDVLAGSGGSGYTGRYCWRQVTYLLDLGAPAWRLPGFVVLGLAPVLGEPQTAIKAVADRTEHLDRLVEWAERGDPAAIDAVRDMLGDEVPS